MGSITDHSEGMARGSSETPKPTTTSFPRKQKLGEIFQRAFFARFTDISEVSHTTGSADVKLDQQDGEVSPDNPRSTGQSSPMDLHLGVERINHISCPRDEIVPGSGTACPRNAGGRRCVRAARCHKAVTKGQDLFQGIRIGQPDSSWHQG